MDAATLAKAMDGRISAAYAAELIGPCNEALTLAQCTTVNRVAMFLAQIAEESVALQYREEIASGEAYNGRQDLGNTQPGDGPRFKGRSFIQITGRLNYLALSGWAHSRGIVPTSTWFVDHPTQLAWPRYAWLGPVWYWTVARPQLNTLADAGDIVGATRAVNGGTNGLATREFYWNLIRALGAAILPNGAPDMSQYGPEHWDAKDWAALNARGPGGGPNINRRHGREGKVTIWTLLEDALAPLRADVAAIKTKLGIR